jgi:hypothetical protein
MQDLCREAGSRSAGANVPIAIFLAPFCKYCRLHVMETRQKRSSQYLIIKFCWHAACIDMSERPTCS